MFDEMSLSSSFRNSIYRSNSVIDEMSSSLAFSNSSRHDLLEIEDRLALLKTKQNLQEKKMNEQEKKIDEIRDEVK